MPQVLCYPRRFDFDMDDKLKGLVMINLKMKGGGKMKKVLIGFIAIVSLLLVTYGSSYAISGACVNCHTMHNSQNGTRMADQDTPYGYLLRAGCISCHSGATGSA